MSEIWTYCTSSAVASTPCVVVEESTSLSANGRDELADVAHRVREGDVEDAAAAGDRDARHAGQCVERGLDLPGRRGERERPGRVAVEGQREVVRAVDLPVAHGDVLHLGPRVRDALGLRVDRDQAAGAVERGAVELHGRDDRERVVAVAADDRRHHGRGLVEVENLLLARLRKLRPQRVAADGERVVAGAEQHRERLDVLELDAAVAGADERRGSSG